MKKYKPGIAVLLLCFLLYNCARSTEDTSGSKRTGTTSGVQSTQNNTLTWAAFKSQSDSLLEISQKQIINFKVAMNRPGNRRNIVKKRRDIIRAEYQLDMLKERLDKRDGEYTKAAKKLKGLTTSNGDFQNEFNEGFCELDSTINKLWKDTLK
ncbi:hypothetical protein [Flavobacterium subsaxonicum]|uniref:Lipoprotein n=1 Tax=Flavobacterium subsaxonicum WB 4.1-42 = DSM 21790 TaxID=1121898 RepID=A0A0A2MQY2_9FLAO|nr:hypothetical protein [Flavobacterium subsaxonicum]KGO95087.1 hypothetical protein Q766_03005 [Flavobacterium subsaxonicum WB 4.1-42 = DSM 21790]